MGGVGQKLRFGSSEDAVVEDHIKIGGGDFVELAGGRVTGRAAAAFTIQVAILVDALGDGGDEMGAGERRRSRDAGAHVKKRMSIEDFGNAGGGRGHQVHRIFPVLVGLHRKSFGPERITTAVFTIVDVKGEEMEPGQGLAVFVEQGGAETKAVSYTHLTLPTTPYV